MRVGRLLPFILICTLIGVVACPKKRSSPQQGGAGLKDTGTSNNQNDGTQHGGGGGAGQSTPEQVNQAIDKAIAMALEPDWSKNIFAQFILDGTYPAENSGDDDRIDVILTPKYVFPNHGKNKPAAETYESPMLKAFGKNKIERIPKGDCPHPPEEETADASVSELSLDATICFSIGNLTKLPSSILLREVLALVFHEAAHMGKAKEPIAKKYQKYFTQYFAARFGDITVDDFSVRTERSLVMANVRIERALEMAKQDPESRTLFAAMGGILGAINSVPYMDDALLIELKAQPKHPQFVENFWYTINLVSQQISTNFEPPWEFQVYTLVPHTGRIARPDEVVAKITEQAKGMKCLLENLRAFETGKLRGECIAKKMSPDDKHFFLPRRISERY